MRPVRKIGTSHSSLRAFHPSFKTGQIIQLESALERDFCCLLEFEWDILGFVEQPVRIEYELAGSKRHYTPDFLAHYKGGLSVLIEVKYQIDLQDNWVQLEPKFLAAKKYAVDEGWEFRVYTEKDIQTPRLKNAKFLLRFRNPLTPVRLDYCRLILEAVIQLKMSTLEEIIQIASQNTVQRTELLPVLWHLLSHAIIGADLFRPLTMQSQVWPINESYSLLSYE